MGGADREVLVTSAYTEGQLLARMGKPAYSYRIVKRAFAGLLRRWGQLTEVDDPQRDLAKAVERARAAGRLPVQVSFLPLQDFEPAAGAVNVVVPAWEFPEVPSWDLGGNPKENWLKQAAKADLIITHTQFSRSAMVRTGIRTPIRVVPVPVNTSYYNLPLWTGQKKIIPCRCHVLTGERTRVVPRVALPSVNANPSRFKRYVVHPVKALLPGRVLHRFQRLKHAVREGQIAYQKYHSWMDLPETDRLELEGVVYTTIFNPADDRKNWEDMVSAFVYALREQADATLVFKLTTNSQDAEYWVRRVADGIRRFHRVYHCKIVLVADYLSDAQMAELIDGSTFYVNSSRAEGSCLPLQDFLAGGRPAIAPANTGMADSLDEEVGLLVESAPEPASWPQNPVLEYITTWHRINWQSLHDQIRMGYELAKSDPHRLRMMGQKAREKMRQLVDAESVWPLLREALDEAVRLAGVQRRAA